MDFRVLPPKATTVEIALDNTRIPMTPCTGDWWTVDVQEAGPGTDYALRLDGGQPLPDPRSCWQPHGVYGPSRVLDHGAFPWIGERWQPAPLASAMLDELHVGTFTLAGTSEAASERLDHVVELGVTHVELMPVSEFPGGRGWGYDGVDLYAPYHTYGDHDGLKRLVNACYSKGLAVLLDVFYNHLGPTGNYLERFGSYFTTRHQTPWGPAVNLNGLASEEVRRFFCDNAPMWLRDYHLDGLRLDAVPVLYRSRRPRVEAIPDPQDPAMFARSKLDWRESAREPHAGLFTWYRGLIRLQRMIPALADGRMDQVRAHGDEHARWLTVERRAIIVACNLATRAQRLPIGREQSSEALLTSDPMIELNASGAALPPDSVVVLGPAEL